jgi:predicted dehydrogenase
VSEELRLGVIGAGGFGLFALQHFTQVAGVRLAGMAGTHREPALAMAKRFDVPNIEDPDLLVGRSDIDMVYIATPPFLHYPQALSALRNGKHVICEKPLAMTVGQATELVALAREKRLVMVANLMQRYNPLYGIVTDLIAQAPLGDLLHGFFENYASDEGLPPEHWFWDRAKSGGIFIEHGVHFFDMFTGWLGPGRVVAAQGITRPGAPDLEDEVNCTVRHGDTVVNIYHGFTQPSKMDRQELRLLFELGDITLYGWVPTRVHLRALADESATKALMNLFPGARLDITETFHGRGRAMMGRHRQLDVSQRIEIQWGDEIQKMHRYGDLLKAMMRDQIAWIEDPGHQRLVTEQNGLDSVELAVQATDLATSPPPA